MPSIHLEDGSAILHCISVTHGSPRLTASSPVSTLVLIPVVVGGSVVVIDGTMISVCGVVEVGSMVVVLLDMVALVVESIFEVTPL